MTICRIETCAVASLMLIQEDRAGRLLRYQLVMPDVADIGSVRGVIQVWDNGWLEVYRREAVVRSSPTVQPQPITGPIDPASIEVRLRMVADGMRVLAQQILDRRFPGPHQPST